MLVRVTPSKADLRIASEIVDFISGLANEGERILVIGGAARLDVALEKLLKAVLEPQPNPKGSDNLFDPDRPLGRFPLKSASPTGWASSILRWNARCK
jgi:hypothetical protein